MTNEEMQTIVAAKTGETNTVLINAYIVEAGSAIINRAFPFRSDIVDVPMKYQSRQIEIAVYLINKQGAEGQTSHNENGYNRSYESASIPESMLVDIIPSAKVPLEEG